MREKDDSVLEICPSWPGVKVLGLLAKVSRSRRTDVDCLRAELKSVFYVMHQ